MNYCVLLVVDTSERAKSQFIRMSFIPSDRLKFEDLSECFSQFLTMFKVSRCLSLIITFYLYCHLLGMSQDVARLDENFACLSLCGFTIFALFTNGFRKKVPGQTLYQILRILYTRMTMTLVIMQKFSSPICHYYHLTLEIEFLTSL